MEIQCVVGDEHVPLHTELQDGGRADWPHYSHQVRVIVRQLEAPRDKDQLHREKHE